MSSLKSPSSNVRRFRVLLHEASTYSIVVEAIDEAAAESAALHMLTHRPELLSLGDWDAEIVSCEEVRQ